MLLFGKVRMGEFFKGVFIGAISMLSASPNMEANGFVESPPPAPGPAGLIWEAQVNERDEASIQPSVEALLAAYEAEVGAELRPGERAVVALKVNTRSGRGLSTSPSLVRAVIHALEKRGFSPERIWIVDQSERRLREAGFLPPLSAGGMHFDESPVKVLDHGEHIDRDWYYDSPLPGSGRSSWPRLRQQQADWGNLFARDRRSYLADLLLFEVDFWINLPVYGDDPAIGIDGALANASIWTVTNARRFLANPSTAASAIAEIKAIPELNERALLHLASLWRYQFIAGPSFNSLYTRSEPLLWLSSDPVALDRMVLDKMNGARRVNGFRELHPPPNVLAFAASLGLGVDERANIRIERMWPKP